MPRNVHSEIHLHIVWHTKESLGLITPAVEEQVHDVIRHRALEGEGVFVHAIGGTRDHVHLAVTIPPTLLLSKWIGQVKGGSAHDLNALRVCQGKFQWQTGYGVVSFATKGLPWVKRYIRDQKRHHKKRTWHEQLERILP